MNIFNRTISSDDMKKIISQLENESSELRKQGTRLKIEVDEVNQYWTGNAADEFAQKCYQIYERIAKEVIMIENLIQKIQNTKRKLELAEKEATSLFNGSGGGRF